MTFNDINHALVEATRPPIYTAMKYWGKKPHNIWREYIQNYTPENGIYLDPFTGSAISAFESVKAGRKAIAFDLNPLTSFIIEVLSTNFDEEVFSTSYKLIIEEIENDPTYKNFFSTTCRYCGSENAIVQNYKWDRGNIYQVSIICHDCNHRIYCASPIQQDIDKANNSISIKITDWYPDVAFHRSPSFTASFIRNIGGNHFYDIWTKRNLFVLSRIFSLVLKTNDVELKKQLLLGFLKTIHLCTKMSVPRRENAQRPNSTSWGRAAYLCSARQMEMNPLYVFRSSCQGKQSVESALESSIEYLGRRPKLLYVDKSNKSNRSKNFDIKYGIIDINTITDYVDDESIDFILTDPPYGGLVQYFDLSAIWLVWLQKYDPRYKPDYDNEITIKKNIEDLDTYQKRFQNGIHNLYRILKQDGKIVFTFHNKDIRIWNAFLNSVSLAGFKIEKVIHQQNRRSGESNVSMPYGTSATDFYIRCIKAPSVNLKTNEGQFEYFIVQKAIQIISLRNEPTPFQILFDGLLAEISMAGFDIENFDQNVESVLSKYIGTVFAVTDNTTGRAGNYWWFMKPIDHIKYPDRLLTDRVEDTILSILRRKVSVSFDDVLAEIFVKYPNGLTPDIKSIDKILKKYANQSGGKWVYKGEPIESEIRKHSKMIYSISVIGRKLGYKVFVGKREQSEIYDSKPLSYYADLTDLSFISDQDRKARIEMIDLLWIDDSNNIVYAFEVENTTKFTSGIQRASNLERTSKKIMVIPNEREEEFTSIRDPLFIDSFTDYGWHYLFYSEVELLKSMRNINLSNIDLLSKNINP